MPNFLVAQAPTHPPKRSAWSTDWQGMNDNRTQSGRDCIDWLTNQHRRLVWGTPAASRLPLPSPVAHTCSNLITQVDLTALKSRLAHQVSAAVHHRRLHEGALHY